MYRWIDHTAELELEIEAASEEGVFEDALAALAELLGEDGQAAADGGQILAPVSLSARDRATLLADWLEELVFLAETRRLVPHAARELRLAGHGLEAQVAGRVGSPPHLVKAVTYHRLGFERDGDRWRATVVLDV